MSREDADGRDGKVGGAHHTPRTTRPERQSTTIELGARSVRDATGILVANDPGYAGSFYVQLAIPWTTLGVVPTVGAQLGLDVHGNGDDDAGPRDRKLGTYATVDDAWTNPSALGLMTLGGPSTRNDPIVHASAAPALDGVAEPEAWGVAVARQVDRTIRGVAPQESDSAASWRAIWTDQALHLLVDVRDERLLRDSYHPWEDDSVEVGIDVHVNDDDDLGARDTKLATFTNVDQSWQEPSLFGGLRLSPAP